MPGTTYPPNAYPGQVQSQSQLTSYVYQRIPDMRPSLNPAMPSQVQNPNIPHRRLTPYDIDSNSNSNFMPDSLYQQRSPHPSFDTNSIYPQSHNQPLPIPVSPYPYPQQLLPPSFTYFNAHHFTNRRGTGTGRGTLSYHAIPPQNLASWNSNVPAIQPLPAIDTINTINMNFPPPPPPLPPSQPQLPGQRQRSTHKVWILDCKHCGTFLSNRGMKSVLLLHQSVSLFSTDALPINCSAYSSNSDVLRPPPVPVPSPVPSPASPNLPPPGRTCECLTQTLCCHGCGSMIGYMIVSPCSRCITSTTHDNRQTNGHRFVFHSSEVVGSVRHYVPDEPGVLPFDVDIEAHTTPSSVEPPPPLSLSSPIPMGSLASASMPGLIGLGSPGSISASSSSSGSGLSGLFLPAGEDEGEVRRDPFRGRGREVSRGRGRFMGHGGQTRSLARFHRSWPAVPTVRSPLQSQPNAATFTRNSTTPLPGLVNLSPSSSSAEEEAGEGDGEVVENNDNEPPSLITSSEAQDGINNFQYPFYISAIQNRLQPQSSPPPLAPLTPLYSTPMPMTIPVPSSIYPHPAQHTVHPHPIYPHPTHSLPFPAGPSPSPLSSSPSPSQISPTAQEKDQGPRKLKKGDVLYWHHLQRSGEIPAVEDDEKARVGNRNSSFTRSGEGECEKEMEKEGEDLGMIVGGR